MTILLWMKGSISRATLLETGLQILLKELSIQGNQSGFPVFVPAKGQKVGAPQTKTAHRRHTYFGRRFKMPFSLAFPHYSALEKTDNKESPI